MRASSSSASANNDHVIFDVTPPTVSGAPSPTYRLRVDVVGDYAMVRELLPTLLPAYCPERHINIDGSFCLYWGEVEPEKVERRNGGDATEHESVFPQASRIWRNPVFAGLVETAARREAEENGPPWGAEEGAFAGVGGFTNTF